MKLEGKRPAQPQAGPVIACSDLDPAVAALLLALDGDVNRMTLAQLSLLGDDLRRFLE